MRRQYVHLTTDRELAQKVGARHGTAALIYVEMLSTPMKWACRFIAPTNAFGWRRRCRLSSFRSSRRYNRKRNRDAQGVPEERITAEWFRLS